MSEDHDYLWKDAIAILQQTGFHVEPAAYGFRIVLTDATGSATGECGQESAALFDEDSEDQISLSVWTGEPPALWVWRPTVRAIVQFLTDSYAKMQADPQLNWRTILCRENPKAC